MKTRSNRIFIWGAAVVGVVSSISFIYASGMFVPVVYDAGNGTNTPHAAPASTTPPVSEPTEEPFVVTYVDTPEPVKGIYMTACVAASKSFRDRVVALVEETELNTIIIDIKDYTGTISFPVEDMELLGERGSGCRTPYMKEFIGELHKKGIYVVGRITVFQDPLYSKTHPDLAVQKASDRSVWTDHKGLSFVEAGAKPFWEYIVDLSRASYAIGFDELNYDYIRFPSDGNMKDIYYPISEEVVLADPAYGKAKVVRSFFAYLDEALADMPIPLSADLFGMTTTNTDDLNIGQVLEYAAPYFEYIAPMVYPSHYPKGFRGYQNVNAVPYEIVHFSMETAQRRLEVATSSIAVLRPWLQDNDYPVHYTPDMVRAQIEATYDAGLTSWMLWDAGNTYTREALFPYYTNEENPFVPKAVATSTAN